MKKIILFLGICLLALGISAQTTMKKGIQVGRNPAIVVVDSINSDGTDIQFWDGATSLIPIFGDTVALETIVPLQSDTVPLFIFGAGGGNAGDTISFTTSTVYGSYRTYDTTIITSINAVMIAGTTPLGTDTLGIQIYWNDSINVTGPGATLLNTSTLGINSVTTGTVDASFANNTIPPGVRVFCKSPGVVTGRKPIYFECTVYGHIINRKY